MKSKNHKIAMIILAAAASKRLWAINQKLPSKNTTLLGHIIEQGLTSIADQVLVVIGSNAEAIIKEIDSGKITIIKNPDWQKGMGTSIASAMQFLDRNSIHFDAVLIALTDQPLIDKKHYNNLITSYFKNNKVIVATKINNRAGVPAIFPSKYFKALSKLDEDYGARKILNNNQEDILILNIGDKIRDIDTLETYKNIYDQYGIE
jgi:molybdenum cofactor cytidylyltransferase